MRLRAFSLIPAVLVALISCGGNQAREIAPPHQGSITALYGTDISNVTVEEFAQQNFSLEFHSIPPEGVFLTLGLAPGLVCSDDEWQGDGHVIHVVGNGERGADIGVRPVDGYHGEKVSLAVYIEAGIRTVSPPPTGPANAVADLTIVDAGAGRMRLAWTEMNVGDYNVNGAVEVADLTPLGVNFNASYDPGSDGTFDNPLFWVDGNRNGLIEVSDITPIGQHFGTFIIGYNVMRNGTVVKTDSGDEVTVARSDAEIRQFLPPRYSFEFDNSSGDEWTVAPLDPQGAVGTESAPVSLPLQADLQVTLDISGLMLFDLDGSGGTGPLGSSGRSLMKVVDPYEILRRIAPGDVPNLMELGNPVDADTPLARFYNLPRDQALALLVMYAPVNDLTTGASKEGSSRHGASQAIEIEHETTVIPFRLPESGPSYLSVDLSLLENQAGGYFTDVATEFNSGALPQSVHVQLDNRDLLVSLDNDGDDGAGLEFADEAKLGDADRFAISNRRLERVVDVDNYGDPQDTLVYGRVSAFDEQAGTLDLYDVYISDPGGGFIQSGFWPLQFSEESDFYGSSGDMVPSELAVDDIVRLDVDYLTNSEQDPTNKAWLRTLYFDTEDHAPVAVLVADPTAGPSPLLVVFNADRSYDIFGTIVKYEFDFGEGNGWEDFGLTTTAPHVYSSEGTYTARLRVTDDDGNSDTDDQTTIEVGDISGDGVVNISITVSFNAWTTTNMTTRVVIYDHLPTGLDDIDWIGREPEDPNPWGRLETTPPEDGVAQVLTWNGIVDGQYWYAITRLVTRWEGDQEQYAVFGPFTVAGDTHDFAHVGEQYDNPPAPG